MRRLIILLLLFTGLGGSAQYTNRDGYSIWTGRMSVGTTQAANTSTILQLGDAGGFKTLLLPRVGASASVAAPTEGMFHFDILAQQYKAYRSGWKNVLLEGDVLPVSQPANQIVYGTGAGVISSPDLAYSGGTLKLSAASPIIDFSPAVSGTYYIGRSGTEFIASTTGTIVLNSGAGTLFRIGGINVGRFDGSGKLLVGHTTSQGNYISQFNGSVLIGNNTSASTATPTVLDLGGTYSSIAGLSPKLKLYNDGGLTYGIGVANGEMYFTTPTNSAGYAWYNNANSEKMRLQGDGKLLVGYTASQGAHSLQVSGSALISGIIITSNGVAEGVAIGNTSVNIAGVAIGVSASAGINSVGIGRSANAANPSSIAIGREANVAGGNGGIAIGYSSRTAGLYSISIGTSAQTTGTGQLAVGSPTDANFGITHSYWGSSVVSSAPVSHTFHASGGSGVDVAGANLSLAGGQGTGTGVGGYISFLTAGSSVSSSTLNSLIERARISSDGKFLVGYTTSQGNYIGQFNGGIYLNGDIRLGNLAAAPTGSNGSIYYNTTSNTFQGYQNGAWKTITTQDANGYITLPGTGGVGWGSSGGMTQGSNDVYLSAFNRLYFISTNSQGMMWLNGANMQMFLHPSGTLLLGGAGALIGSEKLRVAGNAVIDGIKAPAGKTYAVVVNAQGELKSQPLVAFESITIINDNYSVVETDNNIISDNGTTAITLTLPNPSLSQGRVLYITNQGSNSVAFNSIVKLSNTITTNGLSGGTAIKLVAQGADWWGIIL